MKIIDIKENFIYYRRDLIKFIQIINFIYFNKNNFSIYSIVHQIKIENTSQHWSAFQYLTVPHFAINFDEMQIPISQNSIGMQALENKMVYYKLNVSII